MCRNILTTFLKNNKLLLEHLFEIPLVTKGDFLMTNNEIEIINIIRENDNLEQGLLIAIKVFSAFLEQLEADPMLQVGDLQVSS